MDDPSEKLTEGVRNFPCLWRVKEPSYKDARAKENAWKAVAAEVHLPVEECKSRWKSLRDRFVRELKKTKKKKSGEEGPPVQSTWGLFECLSFLESSVKHRTTHTNFEPPENSQSTEMTAEEARVDGEDDQAQLDSSHTPTPPSSSAETSHVTLSPPPAKKSKKRSRGSDSSIEEAILESLKGLQEKRKECLPIEDELFGRQIAATLQGLDPRTKALGKMQIQQLLFSLEFGEPAGPVSSPYTSPYNFQL